MTEPQNDNEVESADAPGAQLSSGRASGHSVYHYETAGIAEREGNVPIWLWIVAVSLLIWGVYYLITYWNAPVAPT